MGFYFPETWKPGPDYLKADTKAELGGFVFVFNVLRCKDFI